MYYEKQRHLLKKIQDTRNIVYKTMMSGTLGPHTVSQLSSAAPSYFPESHQWSEIFSLSKVILVWEKPEVTGHQIWAVGGLSHLGNLMFCQKTLHET